MGAAAVVAGVFAQLQEFFDVEVPRFQIGAHRALALAAVVRQTGHGLVRLVHIDFQIDHQRLGCDAGDGAHAGIHHAIAGDPVALGQRLAAQALG